MKAAPVPVTAETLGYLAATLPERLRELVQPGHLVAIEERDGQRHCTLIATAERWALQTWEPLPAAPPAEVEPEPAAAAPELVGKIDKDSETAEVAAWVKANGWRGSVVGRWVWVPAHQLGGRSPDPARMRAAGFGFSKRRGEFFHTCGVEGVKPPEGRKRWGGRLDRYHNAASVADFKPAAWDPRAHWQQHKDRKRKKAS